MMKNDFPIFKSNDRQKPFVYLDSAATAQKPRAVIDAVVHYYENYNANIHRGVYRISQKATQACESVREKIKNFIHAEKTEEIIFTSGTTEAINLIAFCFGENFSKGDEIIISEMEHHSNIVPWQLLCERCGAMLKIIPMDDKGELNLETFEKLLSSKTKLVSVTHISNVLGTVNPIEKIISLAHQKNIPVLIDGAQAVAHTPIDVRSLDCDFYVFSGHKMYAPTGIGVLYGKEKFLNQMPPYQGGGDMIKYVTFDKTEFAELPNKFEAGTQNMAGIIGLGAAVDFILSIGFEKILKHEQELTQYALEALKKIPSIKIIGNPSERIGVISFVMDHVHPHDLGTILDTDNIAVRVGHHCAQPVADHFNVPATARISFGIYNTKEDVDQLIEGLKKVIHVFRL